MRRCEMQYTSLEGGRHPAQPSLLLLQAVLEDGMRSFLRHAPVGNGRYSQRWYRELRWLTSHDRSTPFTFERICEELGIDAGRLRRRALGAARGARPAREAIQLQESGRR